MEKKIDIEKPAVPANTASFSTILEQEDEGSAESSSIRSEKLERHLKNLAFKIKLLYGRQ